MSFFFSIYFEIQFKCITKNPDRTGFLPLCAQGPSSWVDCRCIIDYRYTIYAASQIKKYHSVTNIFFSKENPNHELKS